MTHAEGVAFQTPCGVLRCTAQEVMEFSVDCCWEMVSRKVSSLNTGFAKQDGPMPIRDAHRSKSDQWQL